MQCNDVYISWIESFTNAGKSSSKVHTSGITLRSTNQDSHLIYILILDKE